MVRHRATPLLVAGVLVFTGCSSDTSSSTLPADTPTVTDVGADGDTSVASSDAASTVFDLLDADARSKLSPSEAALVQLLIAPASAGQFRLAQYEVLDPNGDGRIGDRWYQPKVVHGSCSVKVDSPTMPMATAVYLPGDPTDLSLVGDPMAATQARMKSPLIVGVQVQQFDTAQQRDDYADATEAVVPFMNDPCAATEVDVSTPGPAAFEPPDTGYPAAGFAGRAMIGDSVTMYYRVGDRILLTVSAGHFIIVKGDTPDATDVGRAIPASVALLVAAGLG